MDCFQYQSGQLYAEQVSLSDIAKQYGTPCYIYSKAAILHSYQSYQEAFGDYPHQICYAVKANSHLTILALMARIGAGFDIVSAGELARVLKSGGDAAKTVFSGVGKQPWEIEYALEQGIGCINIESEGELERIQSIAKRLDVVANIGVRLNPDVDPQTHPYISTGLKENKFGLSEAATLAIYRKAKAMPNIHIHSIAFHIGSQLTTLEPYADALDRLLALVSNLSAEDIEIMQLDLGGGLGVRYKDETPPAPAAFWQVVKARLDAHGVTLPIAIEPGRSLVANAGILLTEVNFIKQTEHANFAIVDAGMNDLIRPALYQAYHEIIEVRQNQTAHLAQYDVVGPVCETGDFIGKGRMLDISEGSLLAVKSAGAYCAVMRSGYNSRVNAAEVWVDGDHLELITPRPGLSDLFVNENII